MSNYTDWEQAAPRRRVAPIGLTVLLCAAVAVGMMVRGGVAPERRLPIEEVVAPTTAEPEPPASEVPIADQRSLYGPLSPRSGVARVWTGEQLLVWGGVGEQPYSDGAIYDPARRRWRRVAPAGLRARSGAAGVWTGSEALVVGGRLFSRESPYPAAAGAAVDGAAYNPRTDRWRSLPRLPFPTAAGQVFESDGRVHAVSLAARRRPLAVLDPGARAWRLAPAPQQGGLGGGKIDVRRRGMTLLLRNGTSPRVVTFDLTTGRWVAAAVRLDDL